MSLAAQQHGRRVAALGLRVTGDLRRNHLAWDAPGTASSFEVHARSLRVADDGRLQIGPSSQLAQTHDPAYVHTGLAAGGETVEYVVRALDRSDRVCGASSPVSAASTESVTVTGAPVVSVGTFGGRVPGHALARFGYVRYQSTFPSDVDFEVGRDEASKDWSWLHPGPEDAWAGRRTHRFRLRFDLAEQPRHDLDLALWLSDQHPTRAATASILVNGSRCASFLFADETAGTVRVGQGVPGHGAGPAYLEHALPRAEFRAGENVLEIVKDQGSWIAYDALGIFARS